MDEATYTYCVKEMSLPGSNLLFGMPIVLDTDLRKPPWATKCF